MTDEIEPSMVSPSEPMAQYEINRFSELLEYFGASEEDEAIIKDLINKKIDYIEI
jgi:hypothetical protein